MSKDPAFLFYSSDFLTGTMMMTDTEVGQYIRLLCYQHQAGHFDAVAMQRLCGGNPTASLAAKFKTDSDGLFFNERLEGEVIKRKKHSEKQRDNANKRWQCHGNATAMPLENENENENKIENKIEKTKEPKLKIEKFDVLDLIPDNWNRSEFSELWSGYVASRIKKKKPLTDYAIKLNVNDLVKYFPAWPDAKSRMENVVKSGWSGFVFDDDKSKKQLNGHNPNHSETFIFDKA